MRFSHASLEKAVAGWHGQTTIEPLAWWQNYRFEQRVSGTRQQHFESSLPKIIDSADVLGAHASYIATYVNLATRRTEPLPFLPGNDAARIALPHSTEKLVRVEDLSDWWDNFSVGAPQHVLEEEYRTGTDRFKTFFDTMNSQRTPRPMFAAFEGDLTEAMPDWLAEWYRVLPRILGLGHLEASPAKPRAIALMRYTVQRVLDQPGSIPAQNRFAAPTTIDHKLNSWFMPSPFPSAEKKTAYGCAVNLDGEETLACEIIHRHIDYRLDDIEDITVLAGPVAAMDPVEARSRHLERVRRERGCDGFGRDAQP